ncbi:MAG: sigma-70 family RNA polymerase sigma factor [Planctomycetota bacterium]
MDAQGNTEADDRRDLEACRTGDAGALERLYRRHAPRVFGLALRTLRRADLAEDVVQETFLNLTKSAAGFRGESRVGTWLAAIALNASRMRLRELRRGGVPLDQADEVAAPATKQPSGALEAALAKLDDEMREILLLAATGASYEEIGAALSLSADQVRGRLYRARKELLARMWAEGGEDA